MTVDSPPPVWQLDGYWSLPSGTTKATEQAYRKQAYRKQADGWPPTALKAATEGSIKRVEMQIRDKSPCQACVCGNLIRLVPIAKVFRT